MNKNSGLQSNVVALTNLGDDNSRLLGLLSMKQHDHSIKTLVRPFCHQKNPSMT